MHAASIPAAVAASCSCSHSPQSGLLQPCFLQPTAELLRVVAHSHRATQTQRAVPLYFYQAATIYQYCQCFYY